MLLSAVESMQLSAREVGDGDFQALYTARGVGGAQVGSARRLGFGPSLQKKRQTFFFFRYAGSGFLATPVQVSRSRFGGRFPRFGDGFFFSSEIFKAKHQLRLFRPACVLPPKYLPSSMRKSLPLHLYAAPFGPRPAPSLGQTLSTL